MLPTFYLTPTDHMPKTDFIPLLTKVQTPLLYRALTRVFLGQSMWYDHLPQTLSEGENQEKMTANSSPHHQGLLQEQLVWICVWTAETQLSHYWRVTRVMAWVTPFHSTCSGRYVKSQGLHEGYTLYRYHILPNLGTTERRSLVGISTPDQAGKNSSTKKALNSLWTEVCVAPQHHGLNCHIHAPEN